MRIDEINEQISTTITYINYFPNLKKNIDALSKAIISGKEYKQEIYEQTIECVYECQNSVMWHEGIMELLIKDEYDDLVPLYKYLKTQNDSPIDNWEVPIEYDFNKTLENLRPSRITLSDKPVQRYSTDTYYKNMEKAKAWLARLNDVSHDLAHKRKVEQKLIQVYDEMYMNNMKHFQDCSARLNDCLVRWQQVFDKYTEIVKEKFSYLALYDGDISLLAPARKPFMQLSSNQQDLRNTESKRYGIVFKPTYLEGENNSYLHIE